MKYWFIFLSFLFTINTVDAQRLEKFSEDRITFLKELEGYLTASKNSTMEDIYKEFDKQYKGGVFTPEQVDRIQQVSNLMLSQRMTANPYFSTYLKGLKNVKNDELGDIRFMNWHNTLEDLINNIENRRLKPFKTFLDFSVSFFEDKSLRKSKLGTNWLVNTEKYEMVYEEGQVLLKVEKLDLIAVRGGDSIMIKNTSGYFKTENNIWVGNGGIVTWERLGLGPEVYAELGPYTLEVKKSLYNVDSVNMHYPLYFGNKVVHGKFSDKLVSANKTTEGSYPRFESAESILEINNIGEGIFYKGGFRLQGTTVYGFGSKENKAFISLSDKKGDEVYNGYADLFTIRREERIVSERVESTVYFGQDSIFHPSVNFRFEIPNQTLKLSRGNRGSDRNPFFNSFHQINIDVDQIEYAVESDSIYIGKKSIGFTKSNKPSVFESLEYFEESDYNRIQNIATTNPIALMKVAYLETGDKLLDANYLAQKLNPRFSVENITSLLYNLVAQGFISYDSERQEVELKDKIFHYADASQKKVDYDNLRVTSDTKETNAVFDLKDNSIAVNGVENIEFSVAQRVGLKPTNQVVKINENRNMEFDGKLFSGFAVSHGKDFHFNYDQFDISMDSIRFFDIYIPTGNVTKEGQLEAYSIGSRIEKLSGVLLIDAPSNKSGTEDIDIFPSMQSKDNSYVYYDKRYTQGGVYKRDSFYFELDPFSFNSLDRFGPQDVKFKGTMYSADIFPVFEETLVIKEDSSLGFFTKTPPDGFPVYLGKGTYKGNMDLSNKGYLGGGTLNYLGTNIDSDDLIFKPKQLNGSAERFDLEESVVGTTEFPQARGFDVTIDWRPYQDSMYVMSQEAPFELFKEGSHRLQGTLILTPGGLKGQGLFDWDKASMTSNLFDFGTYSAQSDTTNLKIKAFDADAIALSTSNLNGVVDFDEQMGRFKANAEFLTTTLPYNQYETSFNEFDWDMKEETITFKVLEGKMGQFLSIHPDQDSLRFQGNTALYDLKSNLLKIGGVPFIVTSDAFVYPETGEIEISPGAVMAELNNAKIIADTTSKYHVINRAKVKILGRKEYRASGFYEYNIGNKEQEIEFAEIIGTRVGKGKRNQKKSVTRATGEIHQRDNFYIDHKTIFQGTINLNAEKPNLGFDGFARIESETLPALHWFSIQCEGDKNDLAIDYKTPMNPEGEQLKVGLFLSKETASTYPRILMPLFFRKDRPVMPVNGFMQYDEKLDHFIFGDSARVIGKTDLYKGNKLVYDNKEGTIEMDGKFNLGSGLKHISVDAAGTASTEFGKLVVDTLLGTSAMDSKTNIEAMFGSKLIVPENLLKIMVNDFRSSSFDAAPVAYAKDLEYFKMTITNMFPENEAMKKTINGLSLGSFDLPKKQNPYTFLFSKIPMVWDRDYQSFVSTEEKLGLISIAGDMLNTNITAYVEMKMPTNEDDRLYIYLKSPSQLYYFFGYKQGIMSIVSNNTRFMDELLGMKEKDLIKKMGDEEQYEIQAVEPSTANAFVNRAKAVSK